jgi:hypothetical protein
MLEKTLRDRCLEKQAVEEDCKALTATERQLVRRLQELKEQQQNWPRVLTSAQEDLRVVTTKLARAREARDRETARMASNHDVMIRVLEQNQDMTQKIHSYEQGMGRSSASVETSQQLANLEREQQEMQVGRTAGCGPVIEWVL